MEFDNPITRGIVTKCVLSSISRHRDLACYLVLGRCVGDDVAVVAVASLARARRKRLHQELAFESTIVGDVDKAIFQLDYQFAKCKTLHHWFEMRCLSLPEKKSLIAIREKLVDGPRSTGDGNDSGSDRWWLAARRFECRRQNDAGKNEIEHFHHFATLSFR